MNVLSVRWRQSDRQRQKFEQVQGLDVGALAADEPGPEQLAARQQDLQRIREAIAALPAHCRGVYLLNRVEGMSYPDIARHMGVSVKAVEKQVSKALRLLRLSIGTTEST